ncbi:MAG: helix-turn-helix domain-containing protein [Sphingomonas sp.]|uniref:helix-turn-helix domain-containing protein n=1 Tax=Sphingomonas sp. TaxID=28214 RepID=UPI003F7DEE5A
MLILYCTGRFCAGLEWCMVVGAESEKLTLGAALRSIRQERNWSLANASKATGLSISTLSKIENGQRSLTYDKLVQLAAALSVDVSRLFTSGEKKSGVSLFSGRRSVHRVGEGFEVAANVYTYNYLAHDIIHKRFSPVIMEIHARDPKEFEQLIQHEGDEFTYVLEGEIEVHTEIYAPLRLSPGESVFFDSGVGHAYVNVGKGTARILCIGSDVDGVSEEPMISFAQEAMGIAEAVIGDAAPKRKTRKLTSTAP